MNLLSHQDCGEELNGQYYLDQSTKPTDEGGKVVPIIIYKSLCHVFSNADIAKMRGFSFHGTYWHNNLVTP
jgi:hypothetical protein